MTHPSGSTIDAFELERLADLRVKAAARLQGSAATKGPPARAADALGVLHALASSPATAPDALALLHELQVHQIELDLQAQELRESRAELESALRRQIELYDFQPVGNFTVDPRMVVHELNLTGAEWLGIGRDQAYGLPFDSFLSAESVRELSAAMSSVEAGQQRASCRLTLRPREGVERSVLASVAKDPAANLFLLSLALESEDRQHRRGAS